jgi:hypothetical protein
MILKNPKIRIKLLNLLLLPEINDSISSNNLIVPTIYQNRIKKKPPIPPPPVITKQKTNVKYRELNKGEILGNFKTVQRIGLDHLFAEYFCSNVKTDEMKLLKVYCVENEKVFSFLFYRCEFIFKLFRIVNR